MKVQLISMLAVAIWSIDSLAAVSRENQGDITMKINPSLAQVNLGEYDLNVGERVAVYKKTCTGARLPICSYDRVGNAEVSRILNDKYAEVTLDSGVHFEEGYIIRRE